MAPEWLHFQIAGFGYYQWKLAADMGFLPATVAPELIYRYQEAPSVKSV